MRPRLVHVGTGLVELAVAAAIFLTYWLAPSLPEWMGGKFAVSVFIIAVLLVVFALGEFIVTVRPRRKQPAPEERTT